MIGEHAFSRLKTHWKSSSTLLDLEESIVDEVMVVCHLQNEREHPSDRKSNPMFVSVD